MQLPLLLATPFIGALLFLFLPASRARWTWPLAVATAAACVVQLVFLSIGWEAAAPPTFSRPWVPALGLDFSIWLDGPALFYAWIVCGIGLLIFVYAGFYMDPADSPRRFHGSMCLFLGAMLGVVMSRNLVLMFVFWELTSISSFLLIGHWHAKKSEAAQGALRALLVTGSGGLCLLGGIAWLGLAMYDVGFGHLLEWQAVWQAGPRLLEHPSIGAILVLLLIGAFTKSAQFPFHFWLPGAMEAPTPVSAFLHAATMVKAGIYLLGRMYPAFSDHVLWFLMLSVAGLTTMLIGGFMALMSRDLKQLLAYSTISQLGLLTAYYGFGHGKVSAGELLKIDLLLVASHALFKGGLFMIVGIIDHGAHTRDWTRLGGLAKSMPITAALAVAGCLSMAGVPLTFGFVAKELFIDAAMKLERLDYLPFNVFLWMAVLASFLTVAYCVRFGYAPFFGKPRDPEIHAHEASPGLLLSPALLIGACVAFGLWVPLFEGLVGPLVTPGFVKETSTFAVAMFKHVDAILFLSLGIFLAGGPAVYFAAPAIEKWYRGMGAPEPFRRLGDGAFFRVAPGVAQEIALMVQPTALSKRLLIIGTAMVALMVWPVWQVAGALTAPEQPPLVEFFVCAALAILTTTSALVVVFARNRLTRLLALSFVGVHVVMIFALYRAPDLLLTQVLVEVAILMMFLLLFRRLPYTPRASQNALSASVRGAIALGVGALFALLTYGASVSAERLDPVRAGMPTTAEYFVAHSKYPPTPGEHSGGGNNVVNVILLDFRGIDTMGEVLVLSIALMGALSLLRYGKTGPGRSGAMPTACPQRENQPALELTRAPVILSTLAGPVLVGMLGYGIVLFFQGHNLPGGGFIAGLVVALAFLPSFLSERSKRMAFWTPQRLRLLPPVGLLCIVATGLAPTLWGLPFLRSAHGYIDLSPVVKFEVASALGFDFGVFLIVVGVTLGIIDRFARGGDAQWR